MKVAMVRLVRGTLLGGALAAGNALACDPVLNGCLGCSDDQFPVCLEALTQRVCEASGMVENCDSRRVYDDAERNATISTGTHMSRISTMMRSARKYQLHHH